MNDKVAPVQPLFYKINETLTLIAYWVIEFKIFIHFQFEIIDHRFTPDSILVISVQNYTSKLAFAANLQTNIQR